MQRLNFLVNSYVKKSDYAFVFDISSSGYCALYNALTMNLLYCSQELANLFKNFSHLVSLGYVIKKLQVKYSLDQMKMIMEFIESLMETSMVVNENNDKMLFQSLKEKSTALEPRITIMYLLLSDRCNLRCKYCTVNYNVKGNLYKEMSNLIISKSLRLFRQISESEVRKSLVFFGGEPLLNVEGLKLAILGVRKLFSPEELDISIVTNGTLVTDSIAKLFLDYSVFPIISIDGPELIHNSMRILSSGHGSYKDTVRGVAILKDRGLKVGISTLVGSHNYKILPESINFFIDTLGAFNVGLTLPHIEPSIASIRIEEVTPIILNTWELARDRGFYIVQIGRRLLSFINKTIKLKACPCPSYWAMLRILPSGDITVCENMGFRGKYVMGNVNDPAIAKNIVDHPVIQEWNRRSQYEVKTCWNCFAFGICGAGCPYDAFLETGNIKNPEYRNCYLSKQLLKWAITDLFKQLVLKDRININKNAFYIPTKEDRFLILGKTLSVIQENEFLIKNDRRNLDVCKKNY